MADCEHKSKKVIEKKVLSSEEVPAAYAATITKTVYEMHYQCKDCGYKWSEEKEEVKFD